MIGALADQRDARPQTLHYAIRALDQLSRRMRANATVNDPGRRERGAARARRRHPGAAGPIGFRISEWPPWVALDDNGDPPLEGDELVLVDGAGIDGAPEREDAHHQQILRDAQLLAGLWPHADGCDRDLRAAQRRGELRDRRVLDEVALAQQRLGVGELRGFAHARRAGLGRVPRARVRCDGPALGCGAGALTPGCARHRRVGPAR